MTISPSPLPANATATYCKRKPAGRDRAARRSPLRFWEAEMMNRPCPKFSRDDGAPLRTRSARHDRSILLEAGAGSGKTAVMAGRIAANARPRCSAARPSAAVTFTELGGERTSLALSRDFCRRSHGRPYRGRAGAWRCPMALSQAQGRDNLSTASAAIDEITCSTIHGLFASA